MTETSIQPKISGRRNIVLACGIAAFFLTPAFGGSISHDLGLNWDGSVTIREWMKENPARVPEGIRKEPGAAFRYGAEGCYSSAAKVLAEEALDDACKKHPEDLFLKQLREEAGMRGNPFSPPLEMLARTQIQKNPTDVKAWYVLAIQNKEEAARMIEAFPYLSISYFAKSQHADESALAVADLDRAIALDPEIPIYYLKRGRSLQKGFQDYTKARADFQKAVALEPLQGLGWAYLCEIQFLLGDHQASIQSGTRSLELFPGFWHGLMFRGQAYHALGQYEKAIRDYTSILKEHPDFYWPPELRAYSLLALGKVKEAIADLNSTASEIRPHVIHRLGMAYLLNREPALAIKCFERLNGLWKEHGICIAARVAGDLNLATSRAQELSRKNPEWAAGWLLSRMMTIAAGKVPDPGNFSGPCNERQRLLMDLFFGKTTAAKALAEVKEESHAAEIHLLAGYLALKEGKWAPAAEQFAFAEAKAPILSHTHFLARAERENLASKRGTTVRSPSPSSMRKVTE